MNLIAMLKSAILQLSDFLKESYVLNDLVVEEDFVKLPETGQKERCAELMNQILEYANQVQIACGGSPESYLSELSQIQDDNNDVFMGWLFDYMESFYKTYQDGTPFRDMVPEAFGEITEYCFANFIFQFIDMDEITEQWKDRKEEILKLRKIINFYIRLLVWDGHSKKASDQRMKNQFGFGREHCDIIYRHIAGNEDKLWRRLLVKRINYLEGRLDDLSDKISLTGGWGNDIM